MNSIKVTSRLIKRILLSNLGCPRGEVLTPLISGRHGIGKSAICNQVAKDIGGYAITVEASMLNEGEIGGLPVPSKNRFGETEIDFVAHNSIASIMRIEKLYFEKAKKEGFLKGSICVDEHGNTVIKRTENGKEITEIVGGLNDVEAVMLGDKNIFKFGEALQFDIKMKLIESGEIKPVVLFIDELNRTDSQTMKELMNLVLNKVVNGYILPWWCFIVSAINPASQNSSYAVNEMDDAQLDRFIKLVCNAEINEWVDYGIETRALNQDLIEAVGTQGTNDILLGKRKNESYIDKTEVFPSPRSWSMISHYMDTMNDVNNSKFFNGEERSLVKDDFMEVVAAKVGIEAARMFQTNLSNKKNAVRPDEIINGKNPEIERSVVERIKNQRAIQAKLTADNVIRYLCETADGFYKLKTNPDMKERAKFANYGKQLNQYANLLDDATKTIFLKKISAPTTKTKNGSSLYFYTASFFSGDMLEFLRNMKNNINSVDGE